MRVGLNERDFLGDEDVLFSLFTSILRVNSQPRCILTGGGYYEKPEKSYEFLSIWYVPVQTWHFVLVFSGPFVEFAPLGGWRPRGTQ